MQVIERQPPWNLGDMKSGFAGFGLEDDGSENLRIRSDFNVGTEGTFEQGFAFGATLEATGLGAFAQGWISANFLQATGRGSFAHGYGYYYAIQALADGAIAMGFASAGIIANAVNAVQFGPGTNAVANSLQVGNNANMRATGSVFLKEKADADADVAAWGQLWVNTATPNELYFTDDAGTDHKLAFA